MHDSLERACISVVNPFFIVTMSNSSHKLEWCVVRLGEDLNWWVEEISDPIAWDLDALGIVDPKQMAYLLDAMDPLRDYGLQDHYIEESFFKFKIDKDLGGGRIRLLRVYDSLLESDEPLFALADVIDDEKGPYADFLDHITKLRVKLLNDMIDFKKKLTVTELEEEIREEHHNQFIEGKSIHPFKEVADVLGYIPEGFEFSERDLDSEDETLEEDDDEEIYLDADLPEVEEDEALEEDETMRWDDEEDEDEESEDEDDFNEDEDDAEEDEEIEEKPRRR